MYRLHDSRVRTDFFMQLQDLVTVLTGYEDLKFAYSFGATINAKERRVTASRFWEKLEEDTMEAGLKSDVYLRTIGTLGHSNIVEMQRLIKEIKGHPLATFSQQLFTLLEDFRLEEIVKKERPGTEETFRIRKIYLTHFFNQQLTANVIHSRQVDELFCLIYLLLASNEPEPYFPRANKHTIDQLDSLKPILYSVYEAKATHEISRLVEATLIRLNHQGEEDMLNEYFAFPVAELEVYERKTLFDELTRTDELVNKIKEEVNKEESEYFDETFSTWHRESQNKDRKQNFLQFELEQGTSSSMLGGSMRETEDGDQAMASVQGTAGKSKQNDYSKLEVLEEQLQANEKGTNNSIYGTENKDAVEKWVEADTPTPDEIERYEAYKLEMEGHIRRLANTLKKTLEHQKTSPRDDLLIGRLSKKLLNIVLEENPRVFYKKNEASKEFNAVFTLLIDCSASMVNKMEETKKGILIFHEVLKQLSIPHAITGFWEDATVARESEQPNYFHRIHDHSDSLYENNGPKILQLDAEEDNRDGFSMRVVAERLARRQEKNKFLLIFSDGEPAAMGYEQNGIIDTHLAVSEIRKKGIDVVGLFLADGEVGEKEEFTMQNIYGKEKVIVPRVSELPAHFAPVLKRLLLKTIR